MKQAEKIMLAAGLLGILWKARATPPLNPQMEVRFPQGMGEDVSAFTPQQQTAWYDVIGRFRAALADFEAAAIRLRMQASTVAENPELREEYQSLMNRAARMGPTLQYIRGALDDVTNALSGAWDRVSGAWTSIRGAVTEWLGPNAVPREYSDVAPLPSPFELGGLGVPLIPIAAVIAATAVLTSFLVDYAKFSKRSGLYTQLIGQGQTPEQAASTVNSIVPAGGGIMSSLASFGAGASVAGWAALAAGAYWFLIHKRGRNG